MFYKLQITKESNNFIYPVTDVEKISGAKYSKDLDACVCVYPNTISSSADVEEITEAEYNAYPNCRVNLSAAQIQSDEVDTVTVTVSMPETSIDEEVKLFVDGQLVDFTTTDTNQAVFELTADSTIAGSILEISAESVSWKLSKKALLEVV